MNEHNLGDVLDEAKGVVTGERQDQYGKPEDSFATIAGYWNVYLNAIHALTPGGPGLTALDADHMLTLMKIARMTGGKNKRDNYVDLAGYATIAGDVLFQD